MRRERPAGPTRPHLQVEVDVAPAYELVVSLWAYADRGGRLSGEETPDPDRFSGLRPPGAFLERLQRIHRTGAWGTLLGLAAQAPPPRDVRSFLEYLDRLPPEAICGRLRHLPAPPEGLELPPPAAFKVEVLMTLREWQRFYFQSVEAGVMSLLVQDAEAKRRLGASLAPERLVTLAAGPLRVATSGEADRVVLVPQFHQRPWVFYTRIPGGEVILYPTGNPPVEEAAAAREGDLPPAPLTRLTRALGDESRLRLLRLLAGGDRDFRELAEPLGLSKSTVHHHLGALRAAGLVQLRTRGAEGSRYTLRREAIADLVALLQQYLRG